VTLAASGAHYTAMAPGRQSTERVARVPGDPDTATCDRALWEVYMTVNLS